MHIKRAKQEIKDSTEAYLKKDAAGNYVMPHVRQRPILLMGPPGIGKTQIMEQAARECGIDHPSHQTECGRAAVYPGERVRGQEGFGNRVYHERDHCFGVRQNGGDRP